MTIKLGIIVSDCTNNTSGYTFLQIALKSAGGKPADFLLLHFVFKSAIISATSSGDVVMWI